MEFGAVGHTGGKPVAYAVAHHAECHSGGDIGGAIAGVGRPACELDTRRDGADSRMVNHTVEVAMRHVGTLDINSDLGTVAPMKIDLQTRVVASLGDDVDRKRMGRKCDGAILRRDRGHELEAAGGLVVDIEQPSVDKS